MRTTLLLLFLLFYLNESFAQESIYQKKATIGSTPVLDMEAMVFDLEDNMYLLDRSRVIKMKDGKILMEFNINSNDYTSTNPNVSYPGILADLNVDAEQNIYILNNWQRQVEKYDPKGNLLKVFPSPQAEDTIGHYNRKLLMDSHFNLCIFDDISGKLYYYTSEGKHVKTINIPRLENYMYPYGAKIALDAQDNIYYVETVNFSWDPTLYFRAFSPEGKLIKEFKDTTLKKQGLTETHDMRIDKNGNLNFYKFRAPLFVVSPDGELIRKINPLSQTYSTNSHGRAYVRFDSQKNMYLGNFYEFGSHIFKYDSNYQFVEQFGNLQRPQEVVYDKNNNLYILDNFTFKISKWNPAGEKILEFAGKDKNIVNPLAIAVDEQEHFYILEAGNKECIIRQYDPTGKLINVFPIDGFSHSNNIFYTLFGLAIDYAGNMYVSNYNAHTLNKYDKQGKLILTIGTNGKGPGQLWRPLDITVDGAGNTYVLDMNGRRLQRFSPSGKFIQQFGSFNLDEQDQQMRARISSDAFGNLVVATGYNNYGYKSDFKVELYNMAGKLLAQLPGETPSVAFSRDGSLIAAAHKNKDIVTIYSTSHPREYNFIEGNIYHDANADCLPNTGEAAMADIIIKAEPGPYYGLTDENGNFSIQVSKGSYTLEPVFEEHKGKLITKSCVSENYLKEIHFENYGNYAKGYNFGVKLDLSPHLSVSVSSDRRRRCFESVTKVRYSNTGFSPAENATVYLQLPKEVELLSADKPYTRLADGTYAFAVGTVGANQSGTITLQDKVTCGDESVRGRTVCTRAWITPSNNAPSKPTATVSITGQCNYDLGMVRFVIKNTGQADMTDPKLFRKYIDGDLSSIEQFRLATGDSLVLWVPTSGMTVRLEADQPDGNGDNKLASVTVEACRTSATQTGFSTGIVNLMPSDDEEAEVAEECLPIIDSFDPNDKLVTPAGRTEEHYTPTGVALKYKIRFQNTGTDVAYRVVVVDTLSEHLDLSTLQLGTASHAHRLEVSGKGRPVLTWTFDNIMLPDSTANEPGSHGYILFSIKPKADLPEKTAVENFADIFFDYNSPVRTNVTTNRIYNMPPVVKESVRMALEDIIATPGIAAFAPAAGKFGTEVTLSGKRFSLTAASNKVYFNGKLAQVLSASANELKVRVPAGAATGTLKVITPDGVAGTTESFQVYQPPVLSSFSPVEGIVGSTVTLQGGQLNPDLIQSIKLGNQACEIISNTGSTLMVKVPDQAVTGQFEIRTKGGEAVSASAYTVWHQPMILGLSQHTNIVGSTIGIEGGNFAPTAERNQVRFGQVQAQVVKASATQLLVKVPPGAASGPIMVNTPGGTASSPHFEVIPGPQFTAMTPVQGTVGMEVEITGLHFGILGLQDEIRFNGEKAQVLEASTSRYKVRVPRGASTGQVTITGFGGIAYSTGDFVLEELAPEEAIALYPNPTTGHFTLNFRYADFEVQAVEVYNALGKRVHAVSLASPRPDKLEVYLPQAKAGMYILQIRTDRGIVMKKLTVL